MADMTSMGVDTPVGDDAAYTLDHVLNLRDALSDGLLAGLDHCVSLETEARVALEAAGTPMEVRLQSAEDMCSYMRQLRERACAWSDGVDGLVAALVSRLGPLPAPRSPESLGSWLSALDDPDKVVAFSSIEEADKASAALWRSARNALASVEEVSSKGLDADAKKAVDRLVAAVRETCEAVVGACTCR